MWMQNPNKGQVAVTFRKIQPVPDDKTVRNIKPNIIGLHIFNAARGFIEQHADFYPPGAKRTKFLHHTNHGMARIENVIDQQHIAALDIQAQFFSKD